VTIFDHSLLRLPFFDEQHRALADRLEAWAESNLARPPSWRGVDSPRVIRAIAAQLGEEGWLEHAVSNEREGARPGPDFRSTCLIREAFSYVHDLFDYVFSIQSLAGYGLACFGSDAQREEYLPALRAGRCLGTFAVSEPDAGSDVAKIRLVAKREDAGFRLNGQKAWIANASVADFHCVLARTSDGPAALGMSFILVPRAAQNLQVSPVELLAPRPLGSLHFDDCLLPHACLLGKAGFGFRYALEVLERYRITVGATAIGFCRRALAAALAHSRSRCIDAGVLFDQQLTKERLADMAIFLDSASLLVARAAWEVDTGRVDMLSRHASGAKVYATEGAQHAIDRALQMFGAAGLVASSVTEELYRQVRSLRIYEGASEVQKMIVASTLR
jgi:acyl-CoA dehydrogenase